MQVLGRVPLDQMNSGMGYPFGLMNGRSNEGLQAPQGNPNQQDSGGVLTTYQISQLLLGQ